MGFEVSRNGVPISQHSLSNTFETGIEFGVPHDSLLSELLVMNACMDAGYRYFHDWQDLTPRQKAKIVARYIMNKIVSAHESDAESKHLEKKNKKHGR